MISLKKDRQMPYEDFTTYTEDDASDVLTVTANKVAAVVALKNYSAYRVYKDYGTDHFGATFQHDYKWTGTAENGDTPILLQWAVSNVIEGGNYWNSNNSQAISGARTDNVFALFGYETNDVDTFSCTFAATYYLTAERTGETAMQIRVYSDAGRTILLDTIAVSVVSGRRFRYVFGTNCFDGAGSYAWMSGDTENLDLNEGGGGGTAEVLACLGAGG